MTFQDLIDYVLEMGGKIPPEAEVVLVTDTNVDGEYYETLNHVYSIDYEDGEVVMRW